MKYVPLASLVLVTAPFLFGFKRDGNPQPVWTTGPSSIRAGAGGTVTIVVNQASTTDTVIDLTSSNPDDLPVQSTVTLPANDTEVEVQVQMSPDASAGGQITASANSGEATSEPIAVTD
jgi:hypothetical protein